MTLILEDESIFESSFLLSKSSFFSELLFDSLSLLLKLFEFSELVDITSFFQFNFNLLYTKSIRESPTTFNDKTSFVTISKSISK